MLKYLQILICILFLFAGCATTSQKEIKKQIVSAIPEAYYKLDNDCVLVAINIDTAINENKILKGCEWKRIIMFYFTDWGDPKQVKRGHAMLIFLYPPGQNMLFATDELGTKRIHAFVDDPMSVAKACRPQFNIFAATYLTEK